MYPSVCLAICPTLFRLEETAQVYWHVHGGFESKPSYLSISSYIGNNFDYANNGVVTRRVYATLLYTTKTFAETNADSSVLER
jgi:hypothetical protein